MKITVIRLIYNNMCNCSSFFPRTQTSNAKQDSAKHLVFKKEDSSKESHTGLEHESESCLDELSKIIIITKKTRKRTLFIICAVIYTAYCKSILQLKSIRICS